MRNLRKYKRLSGLFLILAAAVLTAGCSMIEKKAETETELAEGKRRANIEVVSITGNEITYYEIEEETESTTEAVTEAGSGEDVSEESTEPVSEETTELISEETAEPVSGASEPVEKTTEAGNEIPEGGNEATEVTSENIVEASADTSQQSNGKMGRGQRGGMQSMDQNGAGERPSMGQNGTGEMPDMSQMGDGSMPAMSQMGDGSMPDMSQMAEKFLSGASQVETVTTYLPVGVVVYTDTGKKTTFSILEAGDELEVLFETNANGDEIITEIRITGAE